MNSKICWICNYNKADSGEHKVKKSDLNFLYSTVTQKSPIHSRNDGIQGKKIGSINSNEFKFEKVICSDCNNSKTQPFDRSWDTLSSYLADNWNTVLKDNGFKLDSVYASNIPVELVNVQLFFVKLLGCKLCVSDKNFNIDSFSKALNNTDEHPNIYFSIRESGHSSGEAYAANSNIQHFESTSGDIQYLHWFYIIGNFAIDVIHTETPEHFEMNGALKPSQMKDSLKLSQLDYDQSP